MTHQPHLFGPCATIRSAQGDLFAGSPVLAALRCDCGANLIETDNYLICPACLGKLIPDVPDAERSGLCFPDEDEQ